MPIDSMFKAILALPVQDLTKRNGYIKIKTLIRDYLRKGSLMSQLQFFQRNSRGHGLSKREPLGNFLNSLLVVPIQNLKDSNDLDAELEMIGLENIMALRLEEMK
jgi:hypothetical protein